MHPQYYEQTRMNDLALLQTIACVTGVPDVFTRVSNYRDWILQITY